MDEGAEAVDGVFPFFVGAPAEISGEAGGEDGDEEHAVNGGEAEGDGGAN